MNTAQTTDDLGTLINATADAIIRVATRRGRRKSRPPRELALDAVCECYRREEGRRSWDDLLAYCAPLEADSSPASLVRMIEEGRVTEEIVWSLLQSAIYGMPPEMVVAATGGPTPDWWREQYGRDVHPIVRVRPGAPDRKRAIVPRVVNALRIETEEEFEVCLAECTRIIDRHIALGDNEANADTELAEKLAIAMREYESRFRPGEETRISPVISRQSLDGQARLERILVTSIHVSPTQAQRLRLLDMGVDPDAEKRARDGVIRPASRRRKRSDVVGGIDAPLTARLNHYGALMFSYSAVHRFGLANVSTCRLYFDRDRTIIGIELVAQKPTEVVRETERDDTNNRNARRVYSTPNSAYVMATSVLRTYGIEAAAGIECPIKVEQHNGVDLLAVDLGPAVLRAATHNGGGMPHRPDEKTVRRRKPV